MPGQVLSTLMVLMIALAIVGLSAGILIYYASSTSLKSEIVVSKADLRTGLSIISIRNAGNTRIDDILRASLDCESRSIELDKSMFKLPIEKGGESTVVIDLSILKSGELCRISVEAVTETGEKVATSIGLIAVRSL